MAKNVRAGKSFVEVYLDKTKLMRGLKDAKKAVDNFARDVRKIGKISLAAGLSLQALGTMAAKRFASVGDIIAKMARRTGIGVEAISELGYAADLSGSSIGDVETAVRRMQRSIYDAGRGLSTATEALKDLGLSFKDISGLSPEEQFKLIGQRLSSIENPTQKAAIAMSLFGRSGTMLLPMLDNITELADEAKRLGLIMTADMAMRAEKLTDTFTRLKRSINMVIINVGSALEPIISRTTETITRITVKINKWLRENDKIIQGLYNFVPVLIAAGAALIAISNPLGVVAAAAIAFGVKFGVTMDNVKAATTTVTSAFGELIRYLQQTFSVMTEALMAGDYLTAAKAFWVGVQIVWIDGVEKVRQITAELASGFLDAMAEMANSSNLFDEILTKMANVFIFLNKSILTVQLSLLKLHETYLNLMKIGARDEPMYPKGHPFADHKVYGGTPFTPGIGLDTRSKDELDAMINASKQIQKEIEEGLAKPYIKEGKVSRIAADFADRIRKAEDERRKAASEGNAQRKRELEEQLKILRQQTKAAEAFADAEKKGKGAGEPFLDMARQTSESIGMFGGSVLDRLGLGTTVETKSEGYLRQIAESTGETADALGA